MASKQNEILKTSRDKKNAAIGGVALLGVYLFVPQVKSIIDGLVSKITKKEEGAE